jgi:hypothetical protein
MKGLWASRFSFLPALFDVAYRSEISPYRCLIGSTRTTLTKGFGRVRRAITHTENTCLGDFLHFFNLQLNLLIFLAAF